MSRVSWRWLPFVGALPDLLYLLHGDWGRWFITVLHEPLGVPAALATAVALVVAMAWLVHRFVEKPFGPRLRNAVSRSLTVIERHAQLLLPMA